MEITIIKIIKIFIKHLQGVQILQKEEKISTKLLMYGIVKKFKKHILMIWPKLKALLCFLYFQGKSDNSFVFKNTPKHEMNFHTSLK